jgi:hypothetical protein
MPVARMTFDPGRTTVSTATIDGKGWTARPPPPGTELRREDAMGLLQGALLTGAAATGFVVVERVRQRGSGDDVRSDVTELGTTVADQVGRAAGFVGHASGKVLGKSSEVAEGLADRTSRVVSGAGRTVARGAGATIGAYAGVIDRVVPTKGRKPEPSTTTKKSTRKTTATGTATSTRTPASSKRKTTAKAS